MNERVGIGGVLLSILLAVGAVAEGRVVGFEEVQARALKLSSEAVELDASVLRRAGEALAVTTRENPELDVEIRPEVGDGADGDSPEIQIAVSQPVRLGGQAARERVAELIRTTADLERKLGILELSQSVRLTYGKAWIQQERARFLSRLLDQSEATMRRTTQASSQGLLARSGVKALEGQVARLRVERDVSRAEAKRTIAALGRLSDQDLTEVMLQPMQLPELPSGEASFEESAIPIRARLASRVRLLSAQQELARRDALPVIAPRLGYERTAEEADLVTLGFSVSLPVWQRNQAGIQQADAERFALDQAERYASSAAFEAELRLLFEAAREAERGQRAYQALVLPALEEAFDAANKEFLGGQAPANQIFQILAELTDAHRQFVELWTKSLVERVELSALIGSEL